MKRLLIIIIIFFIFISGCSFAKKSSYNISTLPLDNKNLNQKNESETLSGNFENLGAKMPILIYHHIRDFSINDNEQDRQYIVTPQNFEQQLRYLKESGFITISMKNLAEYFEGKLEMPEKPIIITFDDGNRNQYENAFPILKKYGFIATFYIYTNPIERNKGFLNWEQIKEMSEAGMEIGSHSKYHPRLYQITDSKRLEDEIINSKEIIKEKIGQDVSSFSYPFGIQTEQILNIIKIAGYKTARNLTHGLEHNINDLYQLDAYIITDNFSYFKKIVGQ